MARAHPRFAAFTLVEMLVAVAVLTILILMTSSLLSGALKTIANSRKSMDADSEARLVFTRMGADLAGMLRRTDIDYLFEKEDDGGANDSFFFYGQAPAYFATTDASLYPSAGASDPKSSLALVGYRINGSYQLARLGKGLTWDNQGSAGSASSTYNSIVFLAPAANGSGWDPHTLMSGAWPQVVGTPPSYSQATTDSAFQVIGPDVFRLECCYLLKDGTLYDHKIESLAPPASWNTNPLTKGAAFFHSSDSPPAGSDSYPSYAPGSRWYVALGEVESESYICLDAPAYAGSAATWGSLGMQDVAAVIVTIAILDGNSQQLLGGASLRTLVAALPDSNFTAAVPAARAVLPAQAWQAAIARPGFAEAAHIPAIAAAQIRVYQRFFYLAP